jgi:chromosome segregation ATPase
MKNLILNKFYNKIKSKNPQDDVISKVSELVKENEKLEKEIEKLRRARENEKEELNKYYEDLDKKRKEKIKGLKESLKSKENEFKLIINNLIEQNSHLKENFETYDRNKDNFYQDMINNIKGTQQKEIEEKFSNQYHLFKYIRELENSLNKCKVKEVNQQQKIEEIKKTIEKLEITNKCLKEEIYTLQKKIRSLPAEKQIYLVKVCFKIINRKTLIKRLISSSN